MYPILMALALVISAPSAFSEATLLPTGQSLILPGGTVVRLSLSGPDEHFTIEEVVQILGELLDCCGETSTDMQGELSIYWSPAERLRQAAARIEHRDAIILKAREIRARAERVLKAMTERDIRFHSSKTP